jgi:hypothetical protein
MLKSNLREEDEKCADIVSSFLDKNFYSTIEKISFERIHDKKRQIEGFDVIIRGPDDKIYGIDEKAAIRYVNKNLQTFSLELSFLDRKGKIHDGWLFDSNKKNNYFLFVWIDKADKDIISNENDIKQIEIALVLRENIINYLNGLGWDQNALNLKAEKIRQSQNEYPGDLKKYGCKFVCSRHLVEQPVNILIPRHVLISLSEINKMLNF